eukprot:gene20396-biopygen6701
MNSCHEEGVIDIELESKLPAQYKKARAVRAPTLQS